MTVEDFSQAYQSRFVTRPEGIRLHLRDYAGPHDAAPVIVCLAGLTRNSRDFHLFALQARAQARIIAIDSRGRGQSDPDPDPSRYTIETETDDVLAVLTALAIGRAAFIGTSRGGLILHRLVALRPELLSAVVLNDIGPEIPAPALCALIAGLTARSGETSYEAAADALRLAQADAFPALDAQDWQAMAQAIYRPDAATGGVVPDYDPALLTGFGGLTPDMVLPDLWQAFALFAPLPLMVVRGEHSAILPATVLEAMTQRHPRLRSLVAPGQGHAPLLDRAEIAAPILDFVGSATTPPP
ncbi:hypothetical protein BJF92_02440 [Rhizobium rhizosphaerae]|uniref:AB hydrolase-1 domain-containing protein n=1 Tax=Xaviernesmea rhizosphaerae TaxID=1672749 RepID=A0A1Q9AKY3_9HYPH|nr:alpha/beta fold hydrolase [Xaviernesmea rhizosphaerae]OLP55983.1 hypothetical protein BJF92_02440 [Xaviernesmea rhizosphaerae]